MKVDELYGDSQPVASYDNHIHEMFPLYCSLISVC